MKHKIGKREHIKLENELVEVANKLIKLDSFDSDGFQLFYYDVENNKKLVDRKLWLEHALRKGFYYKQ